MPGKSTISFTETRFFKVVGAGNDFLIVDMRNEEAVAAWGRDFAQLSRAQVAQLVCSRYFGFGADGMILLEPSAAADFRWDFYNDDGSHAEMCGNAARCVALLTTEMKTAERKMKFETGAGLVSATVESSQKIIVTMPPLKVLERGLQFKNEVFDVHCDWINSGVPHAVVRVNSLREKKKLRRLARWLRRHPHFGEAGANVTFYRELAKYQIAAFTFERGVEDFTLACGTGAVAAAASFREPPDEVEVHLPGGQLKVLLGATPILTGSAEIIGEVQLTREILDRHLRNK